MTTRLSLCVFSTKRILLTCSSIRKSVPASQLPISQLPLSQLPLSQLFVSQLSVSQLPLSQLPLSQLTVSKLPHMQDNLLKYDKGNIILLDATFGTNHMKMPLYTGLVIDGFGNGVPGFMNLCQGTSQVDIRQWLAALLDKIRQKDPDWMCSCIMVDDAIAEINAIRHVRTAFMSIMLLPPQPVHFMHVTIMDNV